MDDKTQVCPVCKASFETDANECPHCGFKLIGETEAFTPVETEPEQISASELGTIPALEIVKGPYDGEVFTMSEGHFTVGRDPKCDIFLSDMTVSRLHATITIQGETATIVDGGSLNGTWVDDKIVDSAQLAPGSRIQIGTFEMVYEHLSA